MSKSQAQLTVNTSPCTHKGVSRASLRLQQLVEVNGPFIPGGTMCCVMWIQRFTSVAQIGEVQQPRPGFARQMQQFQGHDQTPTGRSAVHGSLDFWPPGMQVSLIRASRPHGVIDPRDPMTMARRFVGSSSHQSRLPCASTPPNTRLTSTRQHTSETPKQLS